MIRQPIDVIERVAVGVFLHGTIGLIIIILSATVWFDWYKIEIPMKYANVIIPIGVIMFCMMYVGLFAFVTNMVKDDRIFWQHQYLIGFITLSMPIVHFLGWELLYLLVSPDIHIFRMVCYLTGIITIGILGIVEACGICAVEMIKDFVDKRRRIRDYDALHEYLL